MLALREKGWRVPEARVKGVTFPGSHALRCGLRDVPPNVVDLFAAGSGMCHPTPLTDSPRAQGRATQPSATEERAGMPALWRAAFGVGWVAAGCGLVLARAAECPSGGRLVMQVPA
jgi:hypothetical protein